MLNDADRRLGETAAGQHAVFTRDDALAAGLTRAQVQRRAAGLWIRMYEGVFRMPGAVPTWRGDLLAACSAAEAKPAAVSHRAGAALYELPGGRTDLIEITCRRWKRTRRPGLLVHESTRFEEIDVTTLDGIPVSTPERVVLELAGLRAYPDYVERVIQAARRKRLITYESTLETFNRLRRRGVPGVRAVRAALERWDPASRPTQSEMESMLLQILRDHGLPEPIVQFDVLDEFGNLVATTDLGIPRWKVTIEYDSMQEHSDEFQIARDNRRRNRILAAGYLPIVARSGDLRTGGHALVDELLRIASRSA